MKITELLNKHITVVLPASNVDGPEAVATIFSGVMIEVSPQDLTIRCADGCLAVWQRNNILGVIENKVLPEDDPRVQAFKEQKTS